MKRRAARGFSLFELVVACVIFAVLAGLLLQRLAFYQAEAERAGVEQTVGTLRAALSLRQSTLAARGRGRELDALAGTNPVTWLAAPPRQYAGEYYAPAAGMVRAGAWYFDRADKTLAYIPAAGGAPLKYRVTRAGARATTMALVAVDE
jgi:prepilin-type N-terminal cleavage/methylation domain-containing protein